jgi:DNA-binding FadR family transcriptional regulator
MRPDTRTQTRPERAAWQIADLARAAGPGTRLGTKELIRLACGVSVGTFNEALRLAQSRGLVEVRPGPGGGLFAAEQSPLVRLGNSVLALDADADAVAVADAIRIREVLDQLIIPDAAWHSSPADIAEYRAQLRAMAAAKDAMDGPAFVHANWRLHELLANVNPCSMLRAIYMALLEIIRSHATEIQVPDGNAIEELMATRYRVHAMLVDAVADRDPDRIRRAIAEHSAEHASDFRRHSGTA